MTLENTIVEECANGVVVRKVSSDAEYTSNIYCERPYVSPDGQRFLYARRSESVWEFVLCEFGTWEKHVVGTGQLDMAVSYQGDYYYTKKDIKGGLEFVRLDLNSGVSEVRFHVDDAIMAGHPTVSPDGRYLAFHAALSYDPQRFAIFLVDGNTGACQVLHEDPFICNAHSQFDDVGGRTILVQHNRGCEYLPDGRRVRRVGRKEGATLFLLDVPSGRVTRLPIGMPYTTPLTGHEAWIGKSRDIIFTVLGKNDFDQRKGNILVVRAGEKYRHAVPGICMNHIGTTPCGRYFHADGGDGGRIIVGSPQTGCWVDICMAGTYYKQGFGQQGHPHAYLSPDFRWVVFNSDRTGNPQVFVASIPGGLFAELD